MSTQDAQGYAAAERVAIVGQPKSNGHATHPATSYPLSIAIVGGGMGGLALAVALGRTGRIKVDLFEQAAAFAEIGAGIHLGPNTIRTLGQMGLADEYASVAETDDLGGLHFEWWDGLTDTKAGETYTKYARSAVHRARLLEVLYRSLPSSVDVHFGARLLDVKTEGDEACIRWAPVNAPADVRIFRASACIGADGVKSAVRAAITGGRAKERFTGSYCYRALIPMEDAVAVDPGFRIPRMWFADERHILIFPIEQGKVLNMVAFRSDRSRPKDDRRWTGPWVQKASPDDVLADFDGWHESPRRLMALMRPDDCSRWALHEVPVPERWREGRVTLLGDACHGSLPHQGSGASMAIEDAHVLASLLAMPACTADNVELFLDAYEAVRRPRTKRQMETACETGEIFEWAHPSYGSDMQRIVRDMPARHDWIWDYDCTEGIDQAKGWLRKKGVVV